MLHAVERALAKLPGVVAWRNSVGYIAQPRPLSYGLGKGSADLIGIVTVGGRGLFLALEVKAPAGRIAPHQQAWLDRVRSMGGIAAVVRSALEAVEVVQQAQAGRVLT